MLRKIIELIFLILMLHSCWSDGKSSDTEMTETTKFHKDNYNRIHYYYNSKNLLIKQTTSKIERLGGREVLSVSSNHFFYDSVGNLKKNILVINELSGKPNSMSILFDYDDNNELIKKVELDLNGDTFEIEKKYYSKKENIKEIKSELIRRNLLNNEDFDTTITLLEERYSDSLNTETSKYKIISGKKDLQNITLYSYNEKGELINSYTLDAMNDTIGESKIEFDRGKLKMKTYLVNELNYSSIEIFDSNGCINKLITIDNTVNRIDTSYYLCDKDCKIIEVKYLVK